MRRRLWMAMVLGAGVLLLTGCGFTTQAAVTKPKPKPVKPSVIIPLPKYTIAETAPSPTGILWVLAGNAVSKGIYEVSLADRKIIGSLSVTSDATSIAMSPTGQLALGAAHGTSGYVEFLSGGTGRVAKTIAVGGAVESLAASPDAGSFYVLDRAKKSASVTVINAQSGKIEETVPASPDAVSLADVPGDTGVYYLQPNGLVSEVAAAGGQLETQFPIGHSGRALALSPDGNTLYVLKDHGGSDNVAVVDLATESVLRAIPVAANATAVTLSPDGSTLYVLVGTPAYGNLQVVKISS